MSSRNETIVSKAFGKQSVIFDDLYDSNPIVNYMRHLIRQEVLNGLKPNDHIFEINSGTGTDAVFFAQQGYQVTALEISEQMVQRAREKALNHAVHDQATFIQGSFENVHLIEGKFDYIYSNFGGLNCTPNLEQIVGHLLDKLKPGGKATLTILPPVTLWEKLHALKGNFKLANRRKSKGPSVAHIEGEHFNCWYYNPKAIIDPFKDQIIDIKVQGLCIFVPPSFMRSFPDRLPTTFRLLKKLDQWVSHLPFFSRIGDYFMLTFTKV